MVFVFALFGHGELRENLVHIRNEGIGDHINDVRSGLAGALQNAQDQHG